MTICFLIGQALALTQPAGGQTPLLHRRHDGQSLSIASTERCHPFSLSTADWLKMSIDAQVTNSKCQRTYCWWSTVIFYWRICCFRRLFQNFWHSCEIYPSAFRCRIYCLRRLLFNFSTINSHMLIVSNLWYLLTKNFNNLHCLNSFMHSAFIRFDEDIITKTWDLLTKMNNASIFFWWKRCI